MHIYHCNPERVRHAGPPHGCAWACHPPCPAVRGCFTACKRDALTGAPLAGAIYGLYQSGRAVQSVVSDVWGRLPFTNLAPGGYAPSGGRRCFSALQRAGRGFRPVRQGGFWGGAPGQPYAAGDRARGGLFAKPADVYGDGIGGGRDPHRRRGARGVFDHQPADVPG